MAQVTEKPKKKKPDNLVIPPPKPKLTKAERRALQEQQRAAKGGGGQGLTASTSTHQQASPLPSSTSSTKIETKSTAPGKSAAVAASAAAAAVVEPSKTVSLVSHLRPYQDPPLSLGPSLMARSMATKLHPAALELGYLYATGRIRGGNARCKAMLNTFQTILKDYEPPSGTADVRVAIDHTVLKPTFQYWTEQCRPHSVSMGNAFSFLKQAVASLDRTLEYDSILEALLETLQAYQRERIEFADMAIANLACERLLQQEEVILVYGYSEVVSVVLQHYHQDSQQQQANQRSRVIVVDSRPLLEGRKMLQELRRNGIPCSYILLNALTYVIQDVTKVLLGSAGLMSDGSVMGRVGAACVALAAQSHHIPVLVCSETYKISNRIQLESITNNELGDPESLRTAQNNDILANWKETPNLKLLNLSYDWTPASFVSGIVTELGIIPPTSVAVLLREMNPVEFKSN